jgi:hypothetical protein
MLWLCAFLIAQSLSAVAQPFNPVRKLTTWYTDRSLIDIEIVGAITTTDTHKLEPSRVLRFRLERAYVSSLRAKDQAGFESVGWVSIGTQHYPIP